jgi:hypothetical protein
MVDSIHHTYNDKVKMKKILFYISLVFLCNTLLAQKEILTQFKLEHNRINCAAMVGDKMVYGASFTDLGHIVLDSTPYRSSERKNYILITDREDNFLDSAAIPYFDAQHMPLHQIVTLSDTSFMAIHFAVSYSDSIIRIVFAEFSLHAIKQPQVRVFNLNLPIGFRPFPNFKGNETNLAPISNLSQHHESIIGSSPILHSRPILVSNSFRISNPSFIYIFNYDLKSHTLKDTVFDRLSYFEEDEKSRNIYQDEITNIIYSEDTKRYVISPDILGEYFLIDSNMKFLLHKKRSDIEHGLFIETYNHKVGLINTINSSTNTNGYTMGGMLVNGHTWQYSMPRWAIFKRSFLIRLMHYDWQHRLVSFRDYAPPYTDDTAIHHYFHVDTPDYDWYPIGRTSLQTAIYHTMCRTTDGSIYFLYNDLDYDDLHGSVVKFNSKGDIESYINIEEVYFSMAGDFGSDVDWFGIYPTPDGGCVITGSHFWRHQWGDPFVLKISPTDFPTAIRKPPLLKRETLSAYPNPVVSHLSFKGLKSTSSYIIEVHGVDGKLILKHRLENGVDNISLTQIPSGLYFYSIINEQNNHTERGKFFKN